MQDLEVLFWFAAYPKGNTFTSERLDEDVVKITGLSKRAARRLVNRLIALKYIVKVEDNIYRMNIQRETLKEAKERLHDQYRTR